MLHNQPVPALLKIIIYVLFGLFIYFQIVYVEAFDTAQKLLSNYTLIKKKSNPIEFNNKIIYISSGKQIYQNYIDQDFKLSFNMIFLRKIARYCIVKETRNNDHRDETHEWVSYKDYSNYYVYRRKPIFFDYSKYFDFKIGNYTVISDTFKNIVPTDYILSQNDLKNFSKSRAFSDLIYLGDGYFFDRNFPDHRNLYTRLHYCRNHDTYIKFEIYNPKKVSVFGLLEDGKITHFGFFKYDFSVIFNGKISANQFIADSVSRERLKTIISGISIIIIVIVLFVHYHRSLFSLFALSFLSIISLHIRAYYLSNFPIKFKYILFYSFFSLLLIIFFFHGQIFMLKNIILIS